MQAVEVGVQRRKDGPRTSEATLCTTYRLGDVVDFIVGNSTAGKALAFTRVALQFPDHLLPDSVAVINILKQRIAERGAPLPKLFVLADTTFAPCCPDEMTAQHYTADAMVHFGYACLSKSTRLPILYVHEQLSGLSASTVVSSVSRMMEQVSSSETKRDDVQFQFVVVIAPAASHLWNNIVEELKADHTIATSLQQSRSLIVAGHTATIALVADSEKGLSEVTISKEQGWTVNGIWIPRLESNNALQRIILIGQDDAPHVHQLQLLCQYQMTRMSDDARCAADEVFEGNLLTCVSSDISEPTVAAQSNKAAQTRLRQRMYNIETVVASSSVGILVATLAIAGYRETAELLKKLIRKSGRRAYIIYVGHLNEYKLANFVDSMDCFVAVSCPNARECHFPTKSDNYIRPVVSPAEILIALNVIPFDHPHTFSTDFSPILQILQQAETELLVHPTTQEDASMSAALVPHRSGALTVGTGSAGSIQRLNERAYIGLEVLQGQTPIQSSIENGRNGIARGYEAEKAQQHNS